MQSYGSHRFGHTGCITQVLVRSLSEFYSRSKELALKGLEMQEYKIHRKVLKGIRIMIILVPNRTQEQDVSHLHALHSGERTNPRVSNASQSPVPVGSNPIDRHFQRPTARVRRLHMM